MATKKPKNPMDSNQDIASASPDSRQDVECVPLDLNQEVASASPDTMQDAECAPPDLNQEVDCAKPDSKQGVDLPPIMTASPSRQRGEEIVTDSIFQDDYFVLKMVIFTITVPTFDSGLDCYQAYYWFQRGEVEIAAICLAFTLVPAVIAFILVFASFSKQLKRLDLVLKIAGK